MGPHWSDHWMVENSLVLNKSKSCGHVYCRFAFRFGLTHRPWMTMDHGYLLAGDYLERCDAPAGWQRHIGSWCWMPMLCAPDARCKRFQAMRRRCDVVISGAWQLRLLTWVYILSVSKSSWPQSWITSHILHIFHISSREGLQRPVFSWQHSSAHRFHGRIC